MLLFFQLQDDNCDQYLKLEDILPNEPLQPISYDTLIILLGTAIHTYIYVYRNFLITIFLHDHCIFEL